MTSEEAVSTSDNLIPMQVQSSSEEENGISFRIRDVQEINSTAHDESNSDGIKRKIPSWLASPVENKKGKRPKLGGQDQEVSANETIENNMETADESNGNAEVKDEPIEENDTEANTSSNTGAQTNADVNKIKVEVEDDAGASTSSNVPTTNNVKPVVVKAEATSTIRDSCQYGIRCYRKNPAHKIEVAHPGDNDYRRPDFPPPPKGTPDCRFGDKCYRRNPMHFQNYSHPPSTDFKKNWQLRQKRLRKQKKDPEFDYYDDDDEDESFSDDPFEADASDDEYVPSDED